MKNMKWMVAFLGMVVSCLALAGGLSMKPGLWQFESKMTVTGMPFAMPPRANTYKKCVTREEAKKIWKIASESKGEKCQYTDLKKSGNHVAWKMKCTGNSNMEGRGEVTFENSNAYHGKMDMAMQSEGQSMGVHAKFNARRIGDCVAK